MISKKLQLVTGLLVFLASVVVGAYSFAAPPPPITNAGWNSMVSSTNGVVCTIAYDGASNVYVGGSFTTAGGVPAKNIAKWDVSTATWSALGSGMNGSVQSIAIDPGTGDVYAGGYFIFAGGVSANCIAKWDVTLSTWSALGGGMDGDFDIVDALAFDSVNNMLYAGGYFEKADGVTVNNIAQWNVAGSSWSALGTGTDDEVNALAYDSVNNMLYVGGYFTEANSITVNGVALWNIPGSSWVALGAGVNGFVNALTFDATGLIAGGWFTAADGTAASNIAKFSGLGVWSALGSGLNNEVKALLLMDQISMLVVLSPPQAL